MKKHNTTPNKEIDAWIGLIASDAERADVIKTFITENAKTERANVAEAHQSTRNLQDTDGYHIVRGLLALALVILVIAASITANNFIDSKRAPQPTPAPATSK